MTTMKSSTFDVDLFETRLEGLKDTQEGIQQMSSWCLQHRSHHKDIVASWLNVFKKVRVEHRLVLFYLANDVIQYSKRKRYEFVESWATALQRATTMVRDEKVKSKILRIFSIWEQREIFSEEYIADLHGLLNIKPHKKSQAPVEVADDFQNTSLINNVRECVELSNATDLSFKKLPKAPSCDIDNIKHQLKDKSHSEDVEKEIERYITYIETYNKNLHSEIKSRKAVLSNLEKAIQFYSNQRGEVKVVVSAYKNFGSRIKLVKKKLDEITPNLPSPIPSPDINAPSPEPDADLQLPDEGNSISMNMFKSSFNGFSSYLDGNLPFDINDFKRDDSNVNKTTSSSTTSTASQPIEVIATRPDDPDLNNTFNTSTEYYKPESISAYPGGENVEIPGLSPMPVPPVQSEYSSLARSAQQYGIIAAPHPPIFGGSRSYPAYNPDNSYLANNPYNGNAGPNPRGMPLMPPPPMPPTTLGASVIGSNGGNGLGVGQQSDDFNTTWDMSMSWTSQLDNSNASSAETPVSPPHFERRGHTIETTTNYVEHANVGATQDVDHRQLHLATGIGLGAKLGLSKEKSRQLDIDHRNLISLTGSPSINESDADKKSWLSTEDKDFRPNKLLTTGDVDYRSVIGVVQTIKTIDTTPTTPTNSSSMKPPPMPPPFLEFESPNKILTQKSSSPQKSNASSSSESQREDVGGGYDPGDMVVDMDMSDEDLDDIFREVSEEIDETEEQQLELSETSLAVDETADQHQPIESATENLTTTHATNARPPLLETPPEFSPPNNMWNPTQTPPFLGPMGIDNMQEQHQLEEEPWNEMSMPYADNVGDGGGPMFAPPPPRPPFHMPQHMQPQYEYPPHPQPHFMGGGDRGGFGGGPGRGRGRGWGHSPQNPFRNSQRPPRGMGGGLGSPYMNRGGRGGGMGGMRGAFRGKFRGNNAWI